MDTNGPSGNWSEGIGYEALDNGFLLCAEPEKLQQICGSLGPEGIDGVFRKWLKRMIYDAFPLPKAGGKLYTFRKKPLRQTARARDRRPPACAPSSPASAGKPARDD